MATMYRWTVTGTTRSMKVITAYVTAATRESALDAGFDSMGLVCVSGVRKVSSKPVKW